MAIFTSILNLLKKNPATDGADTFNIQTMLNDNWDKIDAAMALKGAIGSVRAATASNTTLSGLQTVDGISLAAGDRVLVKNQTTGSQNGIYVAASGAWARAADADSSAKLAAGLWGYVREGTVNGGKSFVLSNAGAVTLGTTALTFAQMSGAGAADDTVIGSRTATDSVTPAMSGTLTGLLSSLFTLVKGITGKSSALTGPAITLEATKSHVDAGLAHGAVSAPTASTMMARDSAGRAQVAAPSAAADIARKDTVDAAIATAASDATTKANSAQAAAIAAAATDATTKANVVQSNLTAHIGAGGAAHAVATTSTAGFLSATDKSKLDGVASGAGTAGSATDTVIGNRTINDAITVGTTDTDTPTNLFSKIGTMIRTITGKADWYMAPRTTLENTVKLNGDTMTGQLVLSADPTSALGAATKQYTDNALSEGVLRQAIINGNFDIWQRGTNFSLTSGGVSGNRDLYSADRHRFQAYSGSGGGDFSGVLVKSDFTPGNSGGVPYSPTSYLTINLASVPALGSSGAVIRYRYLIEGVRNFAGQKISFGFWIRSSIARNIMTGVLQSFGVGGSASVYTPGFTASLSASSSTFTFVKGTIDVPTIMGKTIGSNDLLEFNIVFYKQDNSYYASPSGAYGNFTASTIDLAQIQVNAGETILPFQPRSFGDELALCQRYYEKSYLYEIAPGSPTGFGVHHTNVLAFSYTAGSRLITGAGIRYKVPKRTTPTVTFYDNNGTLGVWWLNGFGLLTMTTGFGNTLGTSFGTVNAANVTSSNELYGHWIADAEF